MRYILAVSMIALLAACMPNGHFMGGVAKQRSYNSYNSGSYVPRSRTVYMNGQPCTQTYWPATGEVTLDCPYQASQDSLNAYDSFWD